MERETGFEPATLALARRCSTTELFPLDHSRSEGWNSTDAGTKLSSNLARTIHEYLLRCPILLPGGAFLVRHPRWTAGTPTLASLVRSPGGLRSRTPRDGIQELSGPASHASLLSCYLRYNGSKTLPIGNQKILRSSY